MVPVLPPRISAGSVRPGVVNENAAKSVAGDHIHHMTGHDMEQDSPLPLDLAPALAQVVPP